MGDGTFSFGEMKLILLEIYFIIFSFNYSDVFCGKQKKVELDYRESNGSYLENFEKTIIEQIKQVKLDLKNDHAVEVFYEIKPPKTSDNNTDPTLLKLLENTITKLGPTLDYNISSEQTSEQTGNERVITLIEYHLTFSDTKIHEDEYILHIDSEDNMKNKKEIIEFIDSLYDKYEKASQANYSRTFKIGLPENSTEKSAEKVRKNFIELFWNRKKDMEKEYFTHEKFRLEYDADKKLKDIDVAITFETLKKSREAATEKQIQKDSLRKQVQSGVQKTEKIPNEPKENDEYDFAFDPIQIEDVDAATKEKIIAELKRHVERSKKSRWWKRSNTVLFTFDMPKEMLSSEITQMVEDLYLDLEDVEPKCHLHPAHIINQSIEIKVDLPPIGKMSVINLNQRFPHVIDSSIPIDIKKDRVTLPSRIEEILEHQLYMTKRRDSGERVYLNLVFNVQRGESEEDYDDFVQRISDHLKTIDGVKFVSYEWKKGGRNRKNLIVRVGIPYSVNKAHGGLRIVAETQGQKKLWFGWIKNIF